MNHDEEWREIPGFGNTYAVSSIGRVRSLHFGRERILRQHPNSKGYLSVSLCVGGKKQTRDVHRLVCEAFHGPCPEGREAAHRDGQNTNNSRQNLAWLTPDENHADRERHGTISKGEQHSAAMRRYWAQKQLTH